MIQCKLLPVREYEHIPFLNKTNKTKFGHYQPMFFSIKGYGRVCWVVASRIKVEEECGDKEWSSVKTELTFINGLVSGIVNFVAPVWYPKTVEVSCS